MNRHDRQWFRVGVGRYLSLRYVVRDGVEDLLIEAHGGGGTAIEMIERCGRHQHAPEVDHQREERERRREAREQLERRWAWT